MAQTYWNLREIARLMAEHDIPTEAELNRRAGLSRMTMRNIRLAGALTRIDVPTVDGLARAFGLKRDERWRLFIVED